MLYPLYDRAVEAEGFFEAADSDSDRDILVLTYYPVDPGIEKNFRDKRYDLEIETAYTLNTKTHISAIRSIFEIRLSVGKLLISALRQDYPIHYKR